jgi:hypothetical protein
LSVEPLETTAKDPARLVIRYLAAAAAVGDDAVVVDNAAAVVMVDSQ